MILNGIKCKSQSQTILEYMKTGKPITQEDSYNLCGSQRLGAIIFNLRKKGYDIQSLPASGLNRFGNKTKFVRYFLSNTAEEINIIENGKS